MKPTNLKLLVWQELMNSSMDKPIAHISKEVDCTYSHVVRSLRELERQGLITQKKSGREVIYTFTKDGKKVHDAVNIIVNRVVWCRR